MLGRYSDYGSTVIERLHSGSEVKLPLGKILQRSIKTMLTSVVGHRERDRASNGS